MSKRRAKRTKGHGSVFPDPRSPYLQISYWNGTRQVRESARMDDHTEAVKLLQRKLAEHVIGKSACPERIKLAALLQLVVAYHLGMRTGELLALKRSWVDLPGAHLREGPGDKESRAENGTDLR